MCGKECSRNSKNKICKSCWQTICPKKFTVSIEQLKKDVEELPLEVVGEKYKVSGNAIRKRCRRLKIIIPIREPGYWVKKYSVEKIT